MQNTPITPEQALLQEICLAPSMTTKTVNTASEEATCAAECNGNCHGFFE